MLEQIYRVIFEFAQDFDLNTQSARRAFQKAERSVAKSPYRLKRGGAISNLAPYRRNLRRLVSGTRLP